MCPVFNGEANPAHSRVFLSMETMMRLFVIVSTMKRILQQGEYGTYH